MIVPGSPHAFMLAAAADPLDNMLAIGHSVRMRKSVTPSLSRTTGTAAADRKKATISMWLKRGSLTNRHVIYSVNPAGGAGSANQLTMLFEDSGGSGNGDFLVANNAATNRSTTAQFRDPSSHFHFHQQFDTTQATAADRVKTWINGVLDTSINMGQDMALNSDTPFGQASVLEYFGSKNAGGLEFDGYFADIYCLVGQSLPPTSFGLFHPRTNQWRPKQFTGTYGVKDYHLDLSDGSAATAAALGADRSGNGNNWTPTNISVTAGVTNDWLLDTPTNNFCTWNSLVPSAGTLTDGALTTAGLAMGTQSALAFNAYWEITADAVGVTAGTITGPGGTASVVSVPNAKTFGFRITPAGALDYINITDVGAWTSIVTGIISAFPYSTGAACTANFGQRTFAGTIPTGFKSPCTKNLPKPTTLAKSTNSFVAVVDSGANVQATLAAARSGWTNYIEIFKRREAVEGWRWRFASDLANYLDSSSTAAKAAFPSLTGASYVGYALRVSPSYGVATGTFVHVNGVADTITDALGQIRKMILLKREDATSDWLVYHPDLTAGKLLYLNLTSAETVDASISTVLSNGFVAAAALASGTYRWIALAEAEGFLKCVKWVANESPDGPFSADGFMPQLMICKPSNLTGAYSGWMLVDGLRMPYNAINPAAVANQPNTTAAEGTREGGSWQSSGLDFFSNGIKIRNNNGEMNGTISDTIVGVTIAAFPFRYANAR